MHLSHRVVPAVSPPVDAEAAPPAPLVLLHGLFGSGSNFGTLARRLSTSRQVIVPDLRNHGSSFWDADCSIEAMAGDVLRLLDTAGAERAVLCGHSLGGKVAMAAALLAPARVSRLLVVDIAPVAYSESNPMWKANFAIMDAMAAMSSEVSGASVGPVPCTVAVRAVLPISLGVLLIPQKGPPLVIPPGPTTTPHGLSSRLLLGTGSGVGTVEETG